MCDVPEPLSSTTVKATSEKPDMCTAHKTFHVSWGKDHHSHHIELGELYQGAKTKTKWEPTPLAD